MTVAKENKLGLNLGPKTSLELAAVGITTRAQLKKEGWEAAFRRLIALFPERLNMNMASALIGAELGCDWREIPAKKKEQAKNLIRLLKPKKKLKSAANPVDLSFVEYLVKDQLADLNVRAKSMFGGHALYAKDRIFGIIHRGQVYFKVDDKSRTHYETAGMKAFQPSPKQIIKSYYEVPPDIIEDSEELLEWARIALRVQK